jgi:radical SAM-linked protein
MQRLRASFSRGTELKFLSHLDLMRLWERAFRRAGISLAYSEGFTPHARISLAAPLSVGMTSQAELMDIFLSRWTSPHSFIGQVKEQLPQGLTILDIWSIGLNEPSLQSQVRSIEYKVEIETDREAQEIESAIKTLLSAQEIPWHHLRDTGARHYDLRPLVGDLWLIELQDSRCMLGMELRCSSSGTGRPEQVTKALGFSQHPRSIHRTKLILT